MSLSLTLKYFIIKKWRWPGVFVTLWALALVIFVLLLHKKLYIVLCIYSIFSCLGFGEEINKWLKIGIINVFIIVTFPRDVRIRFSHCFTNFSSCTSFIV